MELRSSSPTVSPLRATDGVRVGAGVGMAFATGDVGDAELFDSSLQVNARAGYGLLVEGGQVEVTPAARFAFISWAGIDEGSARHFHFGGEVRGAVHLGRVAPFASLGVGLDVNTVGNSDLDAGKGFGLNIELGAEVLATERLGLAIGLQIHPGFAEMFQDTNVNISYIGVTLQLSILGDAA